MEDEDKFAKQVVEDTKKKLQGIKKITIPKDDKKLNSEFVKKYPKWKEYFELYNNCVKEVKEYEDKYLKSLDEFSENYSNIYENTGTISVYTNNLLKACDEASAFVSKGKEHQENALSKLEAKLAEIKSFFSGLSPAKQKVLAKKYKWKPKEMTYEGFIGYYEKSVWNKIKGHFYGNKSVTLNNINKDRRECSSSMKNIANNFTKLKADIASKLGMLGNKSLNRNIVHLKGSPFDVLKQLYDALDKVLNGRKVDLPKYKNKDLLKMQKGKTLDKKISNSMKKVIKCDWKQYDKIKTKFGDSGNLSKSINDLNEAQEALNDSMNAIIKEMKTSADKPDPAITENLLKELDDSMKILDESADEYKEKEILSLYARVLSVRLGANIVAGFFESLNMAMNKLPKVDSIETLATFAGITTQSTFSNILKFTFEAISFAMSFVPVAGNIIGACTKRAEEVFGIVTNAIDTANNKAQEVKSAYDEIKK